MVDWVSLAIPVAYLSVLVGSLATFSSLYRKRKAAKSASLAPWFPPHLQRNLYLSLLHHEQTSPETNKPVAVPDSVVKAALLRRATEDIHRIIALRGAKQALSTLLARGSVGDDLWVRFQRAEKELEAELEDVVSEANALSPNWGSHIFQSANEIAANARLRTRVAEIQAQAAPEREWWNRRREVLRAEFMRELEAEKGGPSIGGGGGGGVGEKSAAEKGAGEKAVTEKDKSTVVEEKLDADTGVGGLSAGGSEEEGVLVEGGGPTSAATSGLGSGPGTAGSKKKRKGKK